jgi:hypothetical protein
VVIAKVEEPVVNGKTVAVERRKEVRIANDGTEGKQGARAVTYKIAVEKHEYEDAFRLVWDNYVETGLQQDDESGMRFTKYHLMPETKVFIANYHEALAAQRPDLFKGDGKVVGTVTLVVDSPMGLPMEEFCGDEIAKMRAEGRKLAEVIAFALNPEYTKYKVFMHMFKLLFQFSELKGITDICCSVTERHIRFYRKVLLFNPIGELVPYSAAYKLKVQGHTVNIKEVNKKGKELYSGKEFDADLHRFFFTDSFNRAKGEGKPLSPDLLKYFVSEKTNFIDSLEEKDLSLLRSAYNDIGEPFPF